MTQPPKKTDSARRPPTIPYAGGTAPIPATTPDVPQPPAPAPRPITRNANRRSWTDPVVRFWILATIALVGVGGWFVTDQLFAARREAWLISNGAVVHAIAIDSNGDNLHPIGVGSNVSLKFDWQGQETVVYGILATQMVALQPGAPVPAPLHVNPADPNDWTDRQVPEPLVRRVIAGVVIIPAALVTGLAAWLLRRRLLAIWGDGDAELFGVVESKYSALAPLSHTVRCVPANGRNPTIVTVYLPSRFPRPQPNDAMWLLHRRGKLQPAIAVRAFE